MEINTVFENVSADIRDAFFDELYSLALRDKNIVLLTADMGAFSLERFRKDLHEQYFNVGIAEQNMVSVASGLALAGKKVFIYGIAPFVTMRCYEQLKVQLCDMRLNVNIIGAGAGYAYGSDGATHHAINDIAIMRVLPGMNIYNPCDSLSSAAAARLAYSESGPTYTRIDKGALPFIYNGREIELLDGIARVRNGTDNIIITTGIMVHRAFEVAEELEKDSISTGIVDVFKLNPINQEKLISLLEKVNYVIVLEEDFIIGGLGSIISEIVADYGKDVMVKRVAINEECLGYGDREWLHKQHGLDRDKIICTIMNLIKNRKR